MPRPATTAWDAERALARLNVTEEPFVAAHDNVLGRARGRTIAISPGIPLPHQTRFHELAHVLLGHTAEDEQGGDRTALNLRECEAEMVAKLCCAALNWPGVAGSDEYIRRWWGAGKIPKRSALRILEVVDQILTAGSTSDRA